jgi:hypothetical protein
MTGASNVQKTPAGLSLNRFARNKVLEQISRLGKALPCQVVKVVGQIVQVSFQVQAVSGQAPITIPNVTIPTVGFEYVRMPIQVGAKGMTVAAASYLGGMSGLGGGIANTAPQGNLTSLAFLPLGSVSFFSVNGQVLTMYGPAGVSLFDQAMTTFFNLTPGQIQMTAGGSSMTLNSSGLTVNGNLLVDGNIHATGTITP